MRPSALLQKSVVVALGVGALCAAVGQAEAGYVQTDLVSDIEGLGVITDPELVNPWGVSHILQAPFGPRTKGPIPPLSSRLPTGRTFPR